MLSKQKHSEPSTSRKSVVFWHCPSHALCSRVLALVVGDVDEVSDEVSVVVELIEDVRLVVEVLLEVSEVVVVSEVV